MNISPMGKYANNFGKRFSLLCCAALLTVSAVTGSVATAKAADIDTIDTTRKGSVTIYKYDETAATKDGKSSAIATLPTNGEYNGNINTTLGKYALEGVEFTGMNVAAIKTNVTVDNTIRLGYTIDSSLAYILGLTSSPTATSSSESIDGASLTFTSTTLNDALQGKLTAGNTATKNALEAYMDSASGAKLKGITDSSGKVSWANLNVGLYMVVETKVPENVQLSTNPFFVSVPMTNKMDAKTQTVDENKAGSEWIYDITVYPKNQTVAPDVQKVVREDNDTGISAGTTGQKTNEYTDSCTASEGDVVEFMITDEMPKVTSTATYLTSFSWKDTLSKGLVYDDATGVTLTFYASREDAEKERNVLATWEKGSPNFDVKYTTGTDNATLSVALTAAGLKVINSTDDGKIAGTAGDGISDYTALYVAVTYKATVSSSAKTTLGDNGNTNRVVLEWKRTNESHKDTLTDEADVFTYGIDLTKEFQKGTDGETTAADYTAVKFVLQNKTDGYYVNATGADGVYYVTDGTQTDKANATRFVPSKDGKLLINGLEADTYVLTEVNTANGYQLLKSDITIVVKPSEVTITPTTATDTGLDNGVAFSRVLTKEASATVQSDSTNSVQTATMTADGTSKNARVPMTVVNTKGFELPKTGGAGTVFVTIGGMFTVAVGGVLTWMKKRKSVQ